MPKRKTSLSQSNGDNDQSIDFKKTKTKTTTDTISSSSSSSASTQLAPLDSDGLMSFFSILSAVKDTVRTGWVAHRVKNAESVADHMYRMAMMCMLVRDPTVDRHRCMKMSLCHDLAESIIGDITPSEGVSKETKKRIEKVVRSRL
jgi:hypothetical protein